MANWGEVLRRTARSLLRGATRPAPAGGGARPRAGRVRSSATRDRARTVVYAPNPDGAADPGEVVWAWVPYEEDDGRGKDRPLLVVGRSRRDLLALMLSSRPEHAGDRNWVPVGSGSWDRQGRASFARLDRVLELAEHDIRREGAVLPRDRFDRVARELRGSHGWT